MTFTARAAGELRGRLSALGRRRGPGAHVPRRGDAPAPLLRPAGARRPDARADREQAAGRRRRRHAQPARPPTGPACATWPPRSSGRRRRWPPRRTTRPGPWPPRASRRSTRRGGRASTPATRRPSAGRVTRLRGPAAGHRLRDRGAPRRRPEVRAQYRHFVVDEYQDVNPLQQRLLDAWLGGRAEVCVVGDPNQTIYSFTGADPEYLLGFADRYGDAEVVKLERDYRSTPQVVGLANRLIGQAPARKGLPGLRLLGSGRGPPRRVRRAPRRAGRGRRGRQGVPRAASTPGCRPARSPSCSGSTPSPRSTSRRWPTSGCPTCSRAASGSSSGPRSARRCCCCAARAAGGNEAGALVPAGP